MGNWQLDDLGVQARGDLWLNLRHGVRPADHAEVGLCSLSRGGFMVIDPAARSGLQVPREEGAGEGWAIGQAPDGSVYQAGFKARKSVRLYRWNWDTPASQLVAELPGSSFFTLDIAPDGRIYLPDSTSNTLYRYDPAGGQVEDLGTYGEFGAHIRVVHCAADGWVYLTSVDGLKGCIVALDPATGSRHRLRPVDDSPLTWQYGQLVKDGAGRVLLGARRWGRERWFELIGGQPGAQPIGDAQLAATALRQAATPPSTNSTALAFSDGSYVSRLENRHCEITDATGERHGFELAREESPLRIFCVAAGGGRIWGGTFIPLTLFSHDPATGETKAFGNPTRSTGEIYAMVWSRGTLYAASYTEANITRYEPGRPWQPDDPVYPNPVHLGRMKDKGPALHRIYGYALGRDGAVYFAAKGDYGCHDSGIVRIDPATDAVTRWLYPDTTFGAMCRLADSDDLLVAECRAGENGIRFTRLDGTTGEELASRLHIEDDGQIVSWLPEEGGTVVGLHNHRATIFRYDPAADRITERLPELGLGDHCYNALIDGLDGRIWGLTNKCVYAVDRGLTAAERVAEYEDHAGGNFYRFGMVVGPDGAVWFANGTHLMRLSRK